MGTLTQKEKEVWLKKNKGLLGYWANKFKNFNTFNNEELMQIAAIGALVGLNKYTDKGGAKLNNYVTIYIRAELQAQIRLMFGDTKLPYELLLASKVREDSMDFEEVEAVTEDENYVDVNETLSTEEEKEKQLKFLTPFEKLCTKYEMGYDVDIPDEFKPIAHIIYQTSLIKLRRLNNEK